MDRKMVSLLLCLALLCACLPSLAEDGLTVTDMKGREVQLNGPAERIVALTAADCEILYALGAGDRLVGRGEYCDYPEAVLSLPVVKSGAETNLEEVLALQPQVVLMGTMAQTVEQVEALESAGVRVVVSDAQTIAGVYEAIRLIGAVTGKDAEAEALVSGMEEAFAAVRAKAVPTEKTVYFEVSELQWGLWAAGRNTFMDELAEMCGLKNAFADVDGWGAINQTSVLERNPDFIVTTAMYWGSGPKPIEEIKSRPGWEILSAVKNDAIFNADYNAITRPGPRLVEAVEALYEFVSMFDTAEEPAA